MKQLVCSPNAPGPSGAYSPALRVGDFIFVSGQGALDAKTGQVVGKTIEEQTTKVLDNIKALLEAAGASMADVVRCTAHLTDINNFERYNRVYSTYFPDPKPTRTTVQSVLWPGLLVEIDAIAWRPK